MEQEQLPNFQTLAKAIKTVATEMALIPHRPPPSQDAHILELLQETLRWQMQIRDELQESWVFSILDCGIRTHSLTSQRKPQVSSPPSATQRGSTPQAYLRRAVSSSILLASAPLPWVNMGIANNARLPGGRLKEVSITLGLPRLGEYHQGSDSQRRVQIAEFLGIHL